MPPSKIYFLKLFTFYSALFHENCKKFYSADALASFDPNHAPINMSELSTIIICQNHNLLRSLTPLLQNFFP